MAADETPRISAREFETLIRETIPLTQVLPFRVEALGWGTARVRMLFHDAQLRAGGTINGPALMTLADTALYAAVLTRIGMQPLAVTADLSIHFLRKPAPRDLVASATILRFGRRLAVGAISIESADGGPLVAHATASYALPPSE
ncbi:MAG: PaaI family thioesterase [Myxococcota bacterium]|nr:PaaI family thioesterase [Myxococcota bacterium]